jgi:hypothetical protein
MLWWQKKYIETVEVNEDDDESSNDSEYVVNTPPDVNNDNSGDLSLQIESHRKI